MLSVRSKMVVLGSPPHTERQTLMVANPEIRTTALHGRGLTETDPDLVPRSQAGREGGVPYHWFVGISSHGLLLMFTGAPR